MALESVLKSSIQKQMNTERQNSVFYKACEARFDALGLRGLAKWMHRAAKEERQHAQRFFDYLIDRNEVPTLDALSAYAAPAVAPQGAALALFTESLKKEQQNTQAINYLYGLADEVKDPQTCVFLHWFIDEQTQSEARLYDITAQLNLMGDDAAAILHLDQRLKKHDHV